MPTLSAHTLLDWQAQQRKAHRHLLKKAKPFNDTLYSLIKQAGQADMPKRWRGSLVQALARSIVGQQVAAKVAATFWQRLEQAAADQPLAEFLAPANQRKIRACGLSNLKVRFLIHLGEAQRSGFLSARRVRAMDHDSRKDYLTQLDGIGVWTCDVIGIFYCGDQDVWPQGDLAVRRTFARLIGIDEKDAAEHVEIFAPFRSYVALHMWREKNNPLINKS